jgi:phage anti-repressor protein
MSTQLIPFEKRQIGAESIQTVNARDLHTFLQVKQRFNDWVAKRIEQYGFSEGVDFIRYYVSSNENPTAGVDYFLTFDMAKQLSMVERNAKGREARQYFIACEKQLQAQHATLPSFYNPQTKMLIDTLMRVDALEAAQDAQKDVIIATQQEALKAQETALQAQDMALTALRSQQWMSIRQYVYVHDLGPQMPLSAQKSYAFSLGEYSREHGIPMYKAATADVAWPDERTYHVQAIHETLHPWLSRQGNQIALVPKAVHP